MQATAGPNQIVRELSRGAVTACRVERRAAGVVVCRRLVADQDLLGLERWRLETERFRAMVERQSRLAESHRVIASIVDRGEHESVTLHQPASGTTLLRLCTRPPAAFLRATAVAILDGMAALHGENQTHGNVKPGNILISRLSLAGCSVLLTDPAGHAQADPDHDLAALGRFTQVWATGVDPSGGSVVGLEKWGHLEDAAPAWRRVTQALLQGECSAAEAATDLRSSTRGANTGRRRAIYVAGPVLAIAVAGGVWVAQGEPEAAEEPTAWTAESEQRWQELCAACERWLLRFIEEVSLETLERDDHLWSTIVPVVREIRDGRLSIDPREIAGVEGMPTYGALARDWRVLVDEPPDTDAITRAAEASAVIRRAIDVDRWPLRSRLDDLAATFEEREWLEMARVAREAQERISLDAPGGLAAAIDAIIRDGESIVRVESGWQTLTSDDSVIQATGVPLLVSYNRALDAAIRSADVGSEPMVAVEAVLAEWGNLHDRLMEMLRTRWVALDADLVRSEQPELAGGETPDLAAFEAFLEQVQDPVYERLDPERAPHPAREIAGRLGGLAARVQEAAEALTSDDQIESLRQRVDGLAARVRELNGRDWNRRTQQAVEADAFAINGELDLLEPEIAAIEFVASTPMSEYVAALREEASVSRRSEINVAWRTQRDTLISSYGADPDIREMAAGVRDVRRVLAIVDDGVRSIGSPLWLTSLPEDVDRAVVNEALKGSAALGAARLLESVTWSSDGSPELEASEASIARTLDGITSLWESVATMFDELALARVSLRQGLPADRPVLGPSSALAVWDKWTDTPEFLEGRVLLAMPGLASSIERLRELRALEPRQALERLDPADPVELKMDVWLRLSDVAPAWPTDIVELQRDRALATSLEAQLPAEADEALARLRDVSVRRWILAMQSLDNRSDLETALDMAADVVQTAAVGGSLPPDVRYNLAVRALSNAASSAIDDVSARQAGQDFVTAVGGLEVVRGPGIARQTLLRLQSALDDQRQSADPTAMGPATVGWRGEASDDNATIVFSRSIDGRRQELEFVFVSRPESEPLYLLSNEVTIDSFSAIASRGRAWNDLEAEWLELGSARRGERWTSGVRGWTWRQGRLLSSGSWTPVDPTMAGRSVIAGTLDRGANPAPSTTHPIQDVSVLAAARVASLVGCRLPRPTDYRSAYVLSAAGAPAAWNLRDGAFDAQDRYVNGLVSQGVRISRPDEGAFGQAPSEAAEVPEDGTVWFLQSSEGSGSPFHHLIGNVAEFVEIDGDQYGVVGSSSLTSTAADPSFAPAPLSPVRLRTGFSDVGFRLAFDAPGVVSRPSPLVAIRGLVDGGAYLLPSPSAAR